MRLLMVAAPGAGKGTQASKLAERFQLQHIASGDLFRQEIAAGTPLGRRAEAYLTRGDLVPDELVGGMIQRAVMAAVAKGGYVLDGYPRTLEQARVAYETSKKLEGVELQAVIHLAVPREELRRRLLARAHREDRSDDTAVTIDHRLEVYDAQTEPLLEYYAGRGLVINVDGTDTVDGVFATIVGAVQTLDLRTPARP
jgi:adenylate kinase